MRVGYQQAMTIENVRPMLAQSDVIISDFVRRVNDPSMRESWADFLPQILNLNLESERLKLLLLPCVFRL
jgi:hypothetical protein